MSTFRKFLFPLSLLVICFLSTNNAFAQEVAQGGGTSSQPSTLYVKDIALDQTTYKAGDTVTGTFTLYSVGESAIPDAYYTVSLVGDYQPNTLAGTFYDTKQFGPVYIGGNDSKSVNFSYVMPSGVSGEGLGIQIGAKLKSGMPMGWNDAKLTVTGGVPYLKIDDAYVLVNKVDFNVQDGPTVKKGDTVSAVVILKNTTKSEITVTPELKTYNHTESQEQLSDTKSDSVTISPNSSKTITIPLPTFDYTPKVYAGVLSFLDSDNVQRAPSLPVRYIVDGPIATVQSITSDRQYADKGNVVNLTVNLTGTPRNVETDATSTLTGAVISTILKNEKGEIVGSATSTADLNAALSSINIRLIAKSRSATLSAEVKVSYDGHDLASYSTSLSSSLHDFSKDDIRKIYMWGLDIVGILALIIIAFVSFKKGSKKTFWGILAILILLVLASAFTFARAAVTFALPTDFCLTYCEESRVGQVGWYLQVTLNQIDLVTHKADGTYFLTGSAIETACTNGSMGLNYIIQYPSPDDNTYITVTKRTGNLMGSPGNEGVHKLTDQVSFGPYPAIQTSGLHKIKFELDQGDLANRFITTPLKNARIKSIGHIDYVFPLSMVSCGPTPATSNVGDAVTWNANVTGGVPPYTYRWYVNPQGTFGEKIVTSTDASPLVEHYSTTGTYSKFLAVVDSIGEYVGLGALSAGYGRKACSVEAVGVAPCPQLGQTCLSDVNNCNETNSGTYTSCDADGNGTNCSAVAPADRSDCDTPPVINCPSDKVLDPATGECVCPAGECLNANGVCVLPGDNRCVANNIVNNCGLVTQCLNNQICEMVGGVATCITNPNPPIDTTQITLTANPTHVQAGGYCTLSWNVKGVTACTLNGVGINNANLSISSGTGSMAGGALNSSATYTMNCSSATQTVTKTATCSVTPVIIEN